MRYKQILMIEIVKVAMVAICVLVNIKVAVVEVFIYFTVISRAN